MRRLKSQLTALSLILALTGCTSPSARVTSDAGAEPARAPRRASTRSKAPARNRSVQFEAPTAAPPAEAPATRPTPNDHQAQAIRIADPITRTALGLFGDLGNTNQQHASALDSPDNLHAVTYTVEGTDFDPAIDATGNMLVYASTRHRQTADLYLQRVDGSTVTQLTSDPANDVMPVFSPNGQRVAFTSDRAGNWDIYLMDVRGGQPVQLTNDPTEEIHPSFSPDGKQLIYSSFGSQSGQWELVVIDIDNPSTKRFVGYGLFPEWSPTENRIVFQRARQRGTRWFSIWTLDLVRGEGIRPTEIVASSNAAAITPNWSPDGRRIVFCTVLDPEDTQNASPEQADLWMIGINGTSRVNLTNSPFANLQPTWSANGSIYFVSDRGEPGKENIWAINPDRALRVSNPGQAPVQASAGIPGSPSSRQQRTLPEDFFNNDPKNTSDESTALVPTEE